MLSGIRRLLRDLPGTYIARHRRHACPKGQPGGEMSCLGTANPVKANAPGLGTARISSQKHGVDGLEGVALKGRKELTGG